MTFRLYIVPVIGNGTRQDPRRPKYFADGSLAGQYPIAAVDYGFEPWMVVGADMSTSDDNFVVSQPDAFALPFDLSTNLTSQQVTNVQNKLEAINVPAGWVDTSDTWLIVVRIVLGLFEFIGRYSAIYANATGSIAPSIFIAGRTLNSTFGSLPQAVQDAMIATAQSYNISTAGLTANTTLRVILKALADNFQDHQYNFSGVMI